MIPELNQTVSLKSCGSWSATTFTLSSMIFEQGLLFVCHLFMELVQECIKFSLLCFLPILSLLMQSVSVDANTKAENKLSNKDEDNSCG